MIKIPSGCVPCQNKKKLLIQQYDTVYKSAKERARASDKIFAIYFDEEDERFKATEYDRVRKYSTEFHVITKD